MSALFSTPTVVEVTETENGLARYDTEIHGVKQGKEAPHEEIQARLGQLLVRAARTNGPFGVVVLNAVDLGEHVKDLGFLVATEAGPRDARQKTTEDGPAEIDRSEIKRYERRSADFKRDHPKRIAHEPLEVYDRSVVDMARDTPGEADGPAWDWEKALDDRDATMAEEHLVGGQDPDGTREWEHLEPAVRPSGAHAAAYDPAPATDVVKVPLVAPEDRRPRRADRIGEGDITRKEMRTVSDEDLADVHRIPVPEPLAPEPGRRRVSDLPSLMEQDKHVTYALEGWRGSLNKMGMGLTLPPDASEQRRRDYRAAIRPEWRGTPVVTLVNEKGSGGKTPGSLMLAAALKRYGPGDVAVVDMNPSGNAHKRAEWEAPLGRHADGRPFNVRDLGQTYMTYGSLDSGTVGKFLHRHTTDLYALLSRHVSLIDDDDMTAEHVRGAYMALDPYFRALVADTGNQPWDRVSREILLRTTQLVPTFLTMPDREEGVRDTLSLMEERGGHYANLVANAVLKINVIEDSREHRRTAEQWKERWSETVRDVVIIPFDRHLGSPSLRFDDLAPATQEAELRVAAAVAEGFRAE